MEIHIPLNFGSQNSHIYPVITPVMDLSVATLVPLFNELPDHVKRIVFQLLPLYLQRNTFSISPMIGIPFAPKWKFELEALTHIDARRYTHVRPTFIGSMIIWPDRVKRKLYVSPSKPGDLTEFKRKIDDMHHIFVTWTTMTARWSLTRRIGVRLVKVYLPGTSALTHHSSPHPGNKAVWDCIVFN